MLPACIVMMAYPDLYCQVLVIHGTADPTVNPINGQQVVAQYATTLDLILGNGQSRGYITDKPTSTTPGQVPSGKVTS